MRTIEQDLARLVREGSISAISGLEAANDPERLHRHL